MPKQHTTLRYLLFELKLACVEFAQLLLCYIERILQRFVNEGNHMIVGDQRCFYCNVWTDQYITDHDREVPMCSDCMIEFLWCPSCGKSIAETGESNPGGLCHACRAEGVAHMRHQLWLLEDGEEEEED